VLVGASEISSDLVGKAVGGRKLIAVVYADMVGYSHLIGLDDEGTLQRLKKLRQDLIDPAIEEYGGRIVQTGGDSLLIVFDSIDGAVRCAVEVQERIPIHDRDQPPDRAIRFRVGINIGDVIADGTDFHGNAVNVAARLQAECPPGGICVTRAVRDHVHDRLNLVFEGIGALDLKNISRPIEAFVLRPDAVPLPVDQTVHAPATSNLTKFPAFDDQPAIAVPPFRSYAGRTLSVARAQDTTPPPTVMLNVSGNNNTNIGVNSGQITINGVDSAVLTAMATTFANEMSATAAARAQAEARAAELATKLGFTSAAVSEFFRILGKDNVPLEQVPERLIEIAEHFAQTRDTVAALEPEDPHIAEIVGLATQALEAGRLSDADRLLEHAKDSELMALRKAQELIKRAQEAEYRHSLSAAKMLASRGEIARTQLRYKEAADYFEQAAHLVPAGHPHEHGRYLSRQADALSDLGDRKGDNAALLAAIGIYHKALEQFPRDSAASDWALVQYNLGIALTTLGNRESGTAHLNDAVAAFQLALTEQQREATPVDWARTEYRLGVALFWIGVRERETTRLEEAIAAYRLALQGEPRELAPLDWALTQNGLGIALSVVGQRESGTVHLMEAASHLRLALEEQTRVRAPLDWATTENNLGLVLWRLGEREAGTERLVEALVTLRLALEERTRDRVPLDWAQTQNNLGLVLWRLGQRETGTERLKESVTAFRLALEERTRDRVPLEWAQSQSNLGLALRNLGLREDGTARLEEAVAAYRLALEAQPRDRVPMVWALSQNNLGTALRTLGERESGTVHLEEAEAAYRLALEEWPRDRVPMRWAMAQSNLGAVLITLGERRNDTTRLQKAVASLRAALEERPRNRVPLLWAETQSRIGDARRSIGERESGTAQLEEAVAAYRLALEERTRDRLPLDWAVTQNGLGVALERLGERERNPTRLEEAIAAYNSAIAVFVAFGLDHQITECRGNQNGANAQLAHRR
jgi:class 3 adenylate cyclase/tetratricopeptide (TPR) repeat protein